MTISSHTERSSKAKARLERAEALVVSDREVLSGEPCIRGTRVPVYLIGALAQAQGVRKTHAAYPFLTVEQIELVSLMSPSTRAQAARGRRVFPSRIRPSAAAPRSSGFEEESQTHAMYPFLTEEPIDLAALYVEAHPRKGRPPQTKLPQAKPTKYGWTRKIRL